jgi:predicted TIM-barrel enzyme
VNAILQRFGKGRVLLPVVHCIEPVQARRAMDVAMAEGADGVWCISHGSLPWPTVLRIAEAAVAAGAPFVGVNLLGFDPLAALDAISVDNTSAAAGSGVHGLWTDGAGFELDLRDGHVASTYAQQVESQRVQGGWRGTYFGGVAFKYKREVPPQYLPGLARAAVAAKIDVITTSGPATGFPPTVAKIAVMREAIGGHALAIASGITVENVGPFLPLCDAFLVASGIESAFGVFDPVKVRDLAQAIHAGCVS